jgi:hypothetical protein
LKGHANFNNYCKRRHQYDMAWYVVFRFIFGFVWKQCSIVIADSKEESEQRCSKSNKLSLSAILSLINIR